MPERAPWHCSGSTYARQKSGAPVLVVSTVSIRQFVRVAMAWCSSCDCSESGAGASADAHSTVAVLPSSPAADTPSSSSRPRLTCQMEYGSTFAAAASTLPLARARSTLLNIDFCSTEAKRTDHAIAACRGRSDGAALVSESCNNCCTGPATFLRPSTVAEGGTLVEASMSSVVRHASCGSDTVSMPPAGMMLTRICRIDPDCGSYMGETRTSTRSLVPDRHGMSRCGVLKASPCTPHRSTSSNSGGRGLPTASNEVSGSAMSCGAVQPTLEASAPFAARMFPSVPTTQHAPSHPET